ncbi:MAG: hypothetical protein ABIK92_21795 [Pseudomonadota bacterium]
MVASSLAKRLYDLSGTHIQVDVGDGGLASADEAIATPPSGKRLVISKLLISPTDVGATAKVTISVFNSDDTLDYELFIDLMWSAACPVIFDFSSCPIMLNLGQYLAASTTAAGKTVNITVTSFVMD